MREGAASKSLRPEEARAKSSSAQSARTAPSAMSTRTSAKAALKKASVCTAALAPRLERSSDSSPGAEARAVSQQRLRYSGEDSASSMIFTLVMLLPRDSAYFPTQSASSSAPPSAADSQRLNCGSPPSNHMAAQPSAQRQITRPVPETSPAKGSWAGQKILSEPSLASHSSTSALAANQAVPSVLFWVCFVICGVRARCSSCSPMMGRKLSLRASRTLPLRPKG